MEEKQLKIDNYIQRLNIEKKNQQITLKKKRKF